MIAPDGKTIYVSANDRHIHVLPIEGGRPKRVSLDLDDARQYRYYLHGISPDAKTLAYVGIEKLADGSQRARIATLPASGGPHTDLTDGSCPVDGPEYSRDGKWLYFNSEAAAKKPGHAQIFRMPANGGAAEQLTFDERVNWFPHFSPDGKTIAYISFPPGTLGHPADKDVVVRLMEPDGSGVRDLDAFNGGQGTVNVNSWPPNSEQLAYIRYPKS